MDLGDRKRKILQAVIDDYITTAEPVGSRTISKKHDLGLSSATIRNEMADLEDMGLLIQPHTSAGRVPSQLGYRVYVDDLMQEYKLSLQEIRAIKSALQVKISEVDTLIKQFSGMISRFTNYATVVLSPKFETVFLRRVEIITIDAHNLLIVLVTASGIVKNKRIRIDTSLDYKDISKLTECLNARLCNKPYEDGASAKYELSGAFPNYKELIEMVFDSINEMLDSIKENDVYLSGTTNMLSFPEYSDVSKARAFLEFLNEKDNLSRLIQESKGQSNINIKIGNEISFKEMNDSSMVVSNYSIGDRIVGNIGIIGPTRMDYSKVVSSLEFATSLINEILKNTFYDDLNTDN